MIERIGIGAVAMGGALWWAGLLQPSTTVYALPEDTVQSRIKEADLPPFVFGSAPVDGVVHSEPNRVTWKVEKDGHEVMRFVIDLKPVDETHTEVKVAVTGPTEGKFGNVAERLEKDATLRYLYASAMREEVDSVLTGHRFRYSAISGATTAATVAHMGQISASMGGGRKREPSSSSD